MHRRPAGAEPGGAGEERGRRAEEGRLFEEGQPTPCQAVPLETLRKRLPVEIRGRYWGSAAEISGLVRGAQVRGREDIEVEVELQGTTAEPILRWASGASDKVMRVDMCGARCEAMLDAENLLHGEEIKVRKGEDPAWAMNLVEEAPAKEAETTEGVKGGREAEKEEKGRGRSPAKEKKEKKRKKGRSSGEQKSPKAREKKRSSAKAMARKSLKSVFMGTGMDPDPKVRKKVAAKAARRVKKKKKSSSGSSSTSSQSGSTTEESGELFEETQKVRKIGRIAPGALTTAGCKEMANNLLNSTGGMWEARRSTSTC